MTLFEAIGLIFVIFTSSLGTYALARFVIIGLRTVQRQRERGVCEEDAAIQRDIICRAIERSAS